MSTVRVRDDGPWSVTHPEHGGNVTLRPGEPWESTDPVVKTFRWAFQSDADRDVEDASNPPGKRRTVKRPS